MKKILLAILVLTCIGWTVSCSSFKGKRDNQADTIVAEAGDNKDETESDSSEHIMEFETISDKDMWLKVSPSALKSDQLIRLADAYNAFVVMNSIMTDLDLQMRGYDLDDVIKAVRSISFERIKNHDVALKLEAYKKEMLYILSADPDKEDMEKHNPWKAKNDLYAYLSEKYYVNTFGKFDEKGYKDAYEKCKSVPDWKLLMEKRGSDKMVKTLKDRYEKAKDFDARCIYAIELAHAYEADNDSWGEEDFANPAIPLMESLMKERKYSLYLYELWLKWRTLYQDSKGASKDSEIPNRLYNKYRNICACTILSHIEKNPQDIMAINIFLVTASKENILREGSFSFGNQNIVDKHYLFSEEFADEL